LQQVLIMERTTIWELHPIEAMLLLCLLLIEAIARLISDPPRPIRRRVPYSSAAMAAVLDHTPPGSVLDPVRETMEQICQPLAAAAPSPGIAPGVTVAELRTMARQRGITTAGGRQLHKARKADLLAALEP
jgi:hypothetical protein